VARLGELDPGEAVPSGIRFVRCASAPLAPATLSRFEAATGVAVLESYGMTEAASQITANPLDGRRKPGTVGLPVGVDVRVVRRLEPVPGWTGGNGDVNENEDGDDAGGGHRAQKACCATGVVGEVEVRGPSVVTSYASAEHDGRIDPDGWLRTGDLGFLDAEGYLSLVGRDDDVINRSGEKIFPRELEQAVLADARVAAVAVVPEPDEVFGQVPVVYVTVDPAARPDRAAAAQVLEELRRRLLSKVARSKRPAALHLVDALPVGATGKVRRGEVRERPPAPTLTLELA
jgi:acyl-CoA synthetase (AMP-forming)/AMP-acid ligase II